MDWLLAGAAAVSAEVRMVLYLCIPAGHRPLAGKKKRRQMAH